jgi:biotin carboxylase
MSSSEANPPRLLLLASKLGYQTRGFAEAARRLGVEVVFGSDRCHQLEDPWSDGAVPLHFEDPGRAAADLVAALHKRPVRGILALGDRPTETAALAAESLGVRYNSPDSVANCRSKLRQREVLQAAGARVPQFFSFALQEPRAAVLPRVHFPCVVKPLRLAASQGVIRANHPAEFAAAVERIARLLSSAEIVATREPELDRLLVERYILGEEVALEGLLDHGELRILALFDKPDPLVGPFFEETIYVTPSRLPAAHQAAIADCARQAGAALGLTEGPVHAEYRQNDAGPWVLEIAPRPIGGMCARSLRFGPERIPLEELLVRHVMGRPGADLPREPEASGVMMIPVPATGVLERVDGIQQAAAIPGVDAVEITARLHDAIAGWPEGSSYLGFIFARGETPAEVEAELRRAHAELRFTIAPRLPVAHPVTGRTS